MDTIANKDIRHAVTVRAHIYDLNLPGWDSAVRFEMPDNLPRNTEGHWEMISYQEDDGERVEYNGSRFSIAPQYDFQAENENSTVELIFVEYVD